MRTRKNAPPGNLGGQNCSPPYFRCKFVKFAITNMKREFLNVPETLPASALKSLTLENLIYVDMECKVSTKTVHLRYMQLPATGVESW